jgi:hypothetical protein
MTKLFPPAWMARKTGHYLIYIYIYILSINVEIQPLRILVNSMVSSMPLKHPTFDVNKVDITHIDDSQYYRNPAVTKLMGIPWKRLCFV